MQLKSVVKTYSSGPSGGHWLLLFNGWDKLSQFLRKRKTFGPIVAVSMVAIISMAFSRIASISVAVSRSPYKSGCGIWQKLIGWRARTFSVAEKVILVKSDLTGIYNILWLGLKFSMQGNRGLIRDFSGKIIVTILVLNIRFKVG